MTTKRKLRCRRHHGPRILIAMPIGTEMRGDIRTIQWADRLAWQPGATRLDVEFMFSPSNACERGRNVIIQIAARAKRPYTHILTLDSDVLPQPDMIERLLAHDKPIVAGIYPMQIGRCKMWSFKRDGQWCTAVDPRIELGEEAGYPLIEVEAVAGSCVLSRWDVFGAIGWPWYDVLYQPLDDQDRDVVCGEDVYFAHRAIECGYPLFVDVTCTCDHFNRVAL